MKTATWIFCLLCILLLTACCPASLLSRINATPTTYQFPTRIPTPTPTPRPEPPALVAPGWEGKIIHSVCLQIDQTYLDMHSENTQTIKPARHFVQEVRSYLDALNIQEVEGEGDCDATLGITLFGQPNSGSYIGSGRCFSGAEIWGKVSLSAEGRQSIRIPFNEVDETGMWISDCAKQPEEAPFDYIAGYAMRNTFFQLWGKPFFNRLGNPYLLEEIDIVESKLPGLITGLHDPNTSTRQDAAEELGKHGVFASDAIPELIKSLNDQDAMVQRAAADALKFIVPTGQQAEAATQALFKAAGAEYQQPGSEVYRTWSTLIEALGIIGPPQEVIPALFNILGDDWDALEAAAEALGKIPEAFPELIDALDSTDPKIRAGAVRALSYCGPKAQAALPKLINLLNDNEDFVRSNAVDTIGTIGPQAIEAVPYLIKLFDIKDELLPVYITIALKSITGQDFGEDQQAWQDWWEKNK